MAIILMHNSRNTQPQIIKHVAKFLWVSVMLYYDHEGLQVIRRKMILFIFANMTMNFFFFRSYTIDSQDEVFMSLA